MSQSKVSSQIDQLSATRARLQAQLSASLAKLEAESKKVLDNLGADLGNEDKSLKAIVARLRLKNPSLKKLATNLDVSTYDLRARANWNLHMMTAYAKFQAEKAYAKDIKPRVLLLVENVETQLKLAADKADSLKARFKK